VNLTGRRFSGLLPLFLLEAPQYGIQPRLIEADYHFIEGRDDGNAPSPRDLHHLIEGFTIAGNVEIPIGDALLRKILLRHFAIGSGRARVDFYLSLGHGIPPLYPWLSSFKSNEKRWPVSRTLLLEFPDFVETNTIVHERNSHLCALEFGKGALTAT
jgi:hypothetical protein